jgi:hypothetical protein
MFLILNHLCEDDARASQPPDQALPYQQTDYDTAHDALYTAIALRAVYRDPHDARAL